MKYTIQGFQQKALVELGLDAVDATILRWLVDFQATGKMEKYHDEGGKTYHWVSYSHVIEELPILGITSPDVLGRRFKKMVEAGLLLLHTRKSAGKTKMFYSTETESFARLLSPNGNGEGYNNGKPPSGNTDPTEKSGAHPTQKSGDTTLKSRVILPSEILPSDSSTKALAPSGSLSTNLKEAFVSLDPEGAKTWNWNVQGPALAKLVARFNRSHDPERMAHAVLTSYYRKIKVSRDKFWSSRPFTPADLNSEGIYTQVLADLREQSSRAVEEKNAQEVLANLW